MLQQFMKNKSLFMARMIVNTLDSDLVEQVEQVDDPAINRCL